MTSDPDSYRSQVNDLTLLIARMQKNADVVEKDVLRAEDLLVVVSSHLSPFLSVFADPTLILLSPQLHYHYNWIRDGSRSCEQSRKD